MRFFNTAGPVNPEDHYCLDPLFRLDLEETLSLIAQKKYFVLHAPRQTGKTSSLLALRNHLNRTGQLRSLYVNVEIAQSAREDVRRAIKAVLGQMASQARDSLDDLFLLGLLPTVVDSYGEDGALQTALTLWCKQDPRPLVLMIDEIDTMVGDSLISVLRQIRAGYATRPVLFPQSVILCGVRDVRDYRIHSSRDKAIITGGSAFNIKAKSLRLGNFDREEMSRLYLQHTEETGQQFDREALDTAWELTRGQPWLVNSLAQETCFEMAEGKEHSVPITSSLINAAKERLIQRRETHLDQLVDKLREDRVRRVIEPILAGETRPEHLPEDDVLYVHDLGLISIEGQLRIANRIYQEVIPRALVFTTQLTISHETAWYVVPDGRLDMNALLCAFQQFFRESSEAWLERFDYKEAGPQLLLQAFLQRIVNDRGRVEREYGLGRKRTDLLVLWPLSAGPASCQRIVLELKVLRGSLQSTLTEGLRQTAEYMDTSGAAEGHLLIFDRSAGKSWAKKVFRREETSAGRAISVWGM